MSSALYRASQEVSEEDLAEMVLLASELPEELREFAVARETFLSNAAMAAQGFPGSTTEDILATGRISGYLREFVSPAQPEVLQPGSNLIAATVVHMFDDAGSVLRWMTDKFLGEFEQYVGKDLTHGERLISAERLDVGGFFGTAVGLRPVQTSQIGLVASTIVDFGVGRILGVAYVAALGDVERVELVRDTGLAFERKIVRVLLGSG